MKHCCKNCQFLTKYSRIPGYGTVRLAWTNDELEKLDLSDEWAAECSREIWSTGIDPSLNDRFQDVLLRDRKNQCFFIERHEGMSTSGAIELHKLRNDNRQLKTSYRYTQIALFLAATSLFANLVYNIIKDFVVRLPSP